MYRILGSVLLLASSSLASAAPSAVVPDDYYRLTDVSEPTFAPDGGTIAYTVSTPDQARDEKTSDLWTVPWKGGAAKPLTSTPEVSEYSPRYTPDGKTIVFLSDAGEKTAGEEEEDDSDQLWTMPAAGGPGKRVSSLPGGISDYDLSPDGKYAVVVAEVGKAVGSKAKNPPPVETERFFFKEDGRGYLDDRTQQLFIVDLASGAARQLTSGARDHWRPAWSPDGKLIAYTAKDHGETDKTLAFVKQRLCRLPVDVMGRAAIASAADARAMFYACPEVRSLALSVLRAGGEGGFDVSVNVGPAE